MDVEQAAASVGALLVEYQALKRDAVRLIAAGQADPGVDPLGFAAAADRFVSMWETILGTAEELVSDIDVAYETLYAEIYRGLERERDALVDRLEVIRDANDFPSTALEDLSFDLREYAAQS